MIDLCRLLADHKTECLQIELFSIGVYRRPSTALAFTIAFPEPGRHTRYCGEVI
jgi:hypothetical protein